MDRQDGWKAESLVIVQWHGDAECICPWQEADASNLTSSWDNAMGLCSICIKIQLFGFF